MLLRTVDFLKSGLPAGLLGSYYPSLLAMAHPRLIRVLPPQRLHWPSFDPVGMRALWFARWAPLPAAEQPVLHVWGSSLQELGRLVGTDEALVAPGASSPISCALEAAGVLPRSSTRRRTCDPVKPRPDSSSTSPAIVALLPGGMQRSG